jgi:hypothetical protein
MTETMFYLLATWTPRAESPEDCAGRLSSCLSTLKASPGPFKDWFPKASSKKQATRHPLTLGADTLADVVRSGSHRRDDNKEPISELGYSVGLWNGSRDEPVSISLTCGSRSADPSLANTFLMSLPATNDGASFFCDRTQAKALILAVASAWDAEAATITSDALRRQLPTSDHVPQIGWMTYLSERKAQALRSHEAVERVPGGALITVSDRCHDASADMVREFYDQLASAAST